MDSVAPFASKRDKEFFEIERNILARFVYKNQYQFRRIDILERVKRMVKQLDEFMVTRDPRMIGSILQTIAWASERFLQNIAMGLVLPVSMVCVAAMARVAEILRSISTPTQTIDETLMDEGIPIER